MQHTDSTTAPRAPANIQNLASTPPFFGPTNGGDLVLTSSDGIRFSVHTQTIRQASPTTLDKFLAAATSGPIPTVSIAESSGILALLLQALYTTTNTTASTPSCDAIIAAIDALPKYNAKPDTLVVPGTVLFEHLKAYAPQRPVDVFVVAGRHDIEGIAVEASRHLLDYTVEVISDTIADRMKPIYLKRLFVLHMHRVEEMRRISATPPTAHAPLGNGHSAGQDEQEALAACGPEGRRRLQAAWAMGTLRLAGTVCPDLSRERLEGVFEPLIAGLPCPACQKALRKHIDQAVEAWGQVQSSI
jgi:hypothetical protein